ncbi:hypothetical protein JGU66_07590 [Myxococcaceae bacterium JPH2]|nr:hypothetical protein [Myxococcaceae bacterium JPH2]
MTAFLNGKGRLDVAAWGGKDAWGGKEELAPEALVLTRELTQSGDPDGSKPAEVVLEVPEQATPIDYFPKGHSLYNGWTLYADMPGRTCDGFATRVGRMQVHLAALRFPIGTQEEPYRPFDSKKGGNKGIFDLRTAAGLTRFQEHAREGKAFQIAEAVRPLTHGQLINFSSPVLDENSTAHSGKTAWNYLLGENGRELPKEHRLEGYVPGLLDLSTGDAIQYWLKNGYRKPGKILLEVPGHPRTSIFLREDASIQLETWRKLVATFGVSYGLPSGHSFRNISTIQRGQSGVLNNSIHKTGMAIDFAVNGNPSEANFTRPVTSWPIRMEQRFEDITRDPTASRRKRLEEAKREQQSARAQRQADQLLRAKHAPAGSSMPSPPAMAPTTPEEAARGTQAAKRSVDAARKVTTGALALEKRNAALFAKATVALDDLVAKDDAWLQALAQEIELLQADIDRQLRENARTKNAYRMRWCLYGHSSMDALGPGRTAALKELGGALEALGTSLEEQLASHFDASLKEQATAWVRDVAAQILPFAQIGKQLAQELSTPEGCANVVARYFRDRIRPFLPDPYEADGGTSAQRDLLATEDRPGVMPKLTPFSGTARAYVNISSLGFLCGMHGIGTAGTRWKLGYQLLNATHGFSSIARMVATADDHPDAEEQPVLFARGNGLRFSRAHAELDASFLNAWATVLEDLVVAPAGTPPTRRGAKPGRSRSISTNAPQLTVALPPPELKEDAGRLIGKLKGDFASKRFFVVSAGQETGLADLVTAGMQTGRVLGARLESAFKPFEERLTSVKTEDASSSKGMRQHARKRDRTWLEVTLQPVFEKRGHPTSISDIGFLPKDQVQVSAPGFPRTLEWWHYQSKFARGGSWEEQVNEIGFSDVYLITSPDALALEGGPMDGRGLGYTGSEMESTRGGMALTTDPGNVWRLPPQGW